MPTILAIDDDDSLRRTAGLLFEQEGFRTVLVTDCREGYEQVVLLNPDLVLLDLRRPGMTGVEICRELRAARPRTPIIVLGATGDEMEKVLLLEIGADDYLVKPFGARELVARIRAVLRRTGSETPRVLRFGDVEVNLERRAVRRRGEEIKLTPNEFNLLVYFLQNADRPLTREMILNAVWGYNFFPNTRTVDAHVVRLRQKIAARHFITVHRVGYKFVTG